MRTLLSAAAALTVALAAAPHAEDTINPRSRELLATISPPRSGYIPAPAGVPGDPTMQRRHAGGRRVENDQRRHDVEADLRRRARRIGRRGRGGAVRSERRVRRDRQPVWMGVHDRQGRLQVHRRRKDVGERRAFFLAVHRRHRRRSAQRQQRAGRGAGAAPGRAARRGGARAGRQRYRTRCLQNGRRRPYVDTCAASRWIRRRERRVPRLRRPADDVRVAGWRSCLGRHRGAQVERWRSDVEADRRARPARRRTDRRVCGCLRHARSAPVLRDDARRRARFAGNGTPRALSIG